MLNITLTLTAAPELLAAISNLASSLGSKSIEDVKGDGSGFALCKMQAPQNIHQIPAIHNAPRKNFESVNVQDSTQAMITEQYVQTVLPIDVPVPSVVPTSVQNYTMEQLAVAATQLVDAGRRSELLGLLGSFGVQALTALPREQYGAFATQLRGLGAKI